MNLKLFVWKEVLADYYAGVIFALAKSKEQAIEIIKKRYIQHEFSRYVHPSITREMLWNNSSVKEEIEKKDPEIYETEMAYILYGEGEGF